MKYIFFSQMDTFETGPDCPCYKGVRLIEQSNSFLDNKAAPSKMEL